MSQRKDKAMRKVAAKMTDELIPELANNTNEVIVSMQQTWPHEDKVQFCRWFLGMDSEEALMQELMGGGPGLDELVEDKNQGLLICDGNHAETTPCADPECWIDGEPQGGKDGEENQDTGDTGDTGTESPTTH